MLYLPKPKMLLPHSKTGNPFSKLHRSKRYLAVATAVIFVVVFGMLLLSHCDTAQRRLGDDDVPLYSATLTKGFLTKKQCGELAARAKELLTLGLDKEKGLEDPLFVLGTSATDNVTYKLPCAHGATGGGKGGPLYEDFLKRVGSNWPKTLKKEYKLKCHDFRYVVYKDGKRELKDHDDSDHKPDEDNNVSTTTFVIKLQDHSFEDEKDHAVLEVRQDYANGGKTWVFKKADVGEGVEIPYDRSKTEGLRHRIRKFYTTTIEDKPDRKRRIILRMRIQWVKKTQAELEAGDFAIAEKARAAANASWFTTGVRWLEDIGSKLQQGIREGPDDGWSG